MNSSCFSESLKKREGSQERVIIDVNITMHMLDRREPIQENIFVDFHRKFVNIEASDNGCASSKSINNKTGVVDDISCITELTTR